MRKYVQTRNQKQVQKKRGGMFEATLDIGFAITLVLIALFIIWLIFAAISYLLGFLMLWVFEKDRGDEEITGWEYIERLEKAKREVGGV